MGGPRTRVGTGLFVLPTLARETWVGYCRDMQNANGYMTRIEAAQYARVHVRTITRWLADGHLTKVPGRRGRRQVTLIEVAQLQQLMANTPDGD